MHISTRTTLLMLIAANILLITVHLVSQFFIGTTEHTSLTYQIADRFNMDTEVSIPTWFSQSLLLLVSLLFSYVALIARKAQSGFVKTWWFLAALFLYASIDEGSSLHELATEPSQNLFGIADGLFFFAWVIPGITLFLVICACLLKFFLHLPHALRILFGSAALTLLGAIGVEMISGAYFQSVNFEERFFYRILNALEEGLENSAFIITIYGLLQHIRNQKKEFLPEIQLVK